MTQLATFICSLKRHPLKTIFITIRMNTNWRKMDHGWRVKVECPSGIPALLGPPLSKHLHIQEWIRHSAKWEKRSSTLESMYRQRPAVLFLVDVDYFFHLGPIKHFGSSGVLLLYTFLLLLWKIGMQIMRR